MACYLGTIGLAFAQVEGFYAGKTIRLIIPAAPGDSYDTEGRLIARYLVDHLPGRPKIVSENMPGASGRIVANFMYNIAPTDGTVIALVQQTVPLAQIMGETGVKFDSARFNWIGSPSSPISVLAVWHTAGVRTIDEARSKSVSIGATSSTGGNFIYPKIVKELAGAKFKIVIGYRGGGPINLAMEAGEVGGRGSNPWNNYMLSNPSWISEGKLIPLVQMSLKRHPDLLDVPRLIDLANNERAKSVFEMMSIMSDIGRPMITAPNVNQARISELRLGFAKTMQDNRFQAEARKLNVDIDPTLGEDLQMLVQKLMSTKSETVDLLISTLSKPD
jgi:tripartite-type tricarboxylate transporter receptor subunit TctC